MAIVGGINARGSAMDEPTSHRRRLTAIEGARSTAVEARPRPTVLHVVASQADRIRVSPVIAAVKRWGLFHQVLVRLSLPAGGRALAGPADAIMLVSGPGRASREETDGRRIARLITAFERLVTVVRPQLVVLPGGTTEAFACALGAAKAGVAIAQLDAGLRTGARADQAELDRTLTDRLGDTLLTSTSEARRNLLAEGVPDTRIHVAGSTLIDSVRVMAPPARARAAWEDHGAEPQEYVLLVLSGAPAGTLRGRPLRDALAGLAARTPVIVVVETETRRNSAGRLLRELLGGPTTRFAESFPYLDRLSLACGAGAIVTDVGDVQEEASALGVPCYTLAARTERTVTITHGTNLVLGESGEGLADVHPMRRPPTPCAIPLWDGHAAERVAEVLVANNALHHRART
jgi:UDP-N-acetylglucosamine 2-epimerase (non-hydrolysing)